MKILVSLIAAIITVASLTPEPAAQSDREPRIPIAWNRFYDYDGIVELCQRLADEYDICTLEFIGNSVEGRPMPLLTLKRPSDVPEEQRTAMYVEANVHGNEVQGAEACVYLAWYLLEHDGELEAATELLDERIFYILPMVNPDGRQHWFEAPNTPHSSRSGKQPTDNDGDGLFDEDGPDDLDGDGELLMMRKRVDPGLGTHRISPDDPRLMQRVPVDKRVPWGADYVLLGQEGFDNDGDGRVNEDGPGGYDMNRNWPGGWRPEHIQYGAGDYPFSYPETEAIRAFIMARPNIAAVQSFHNAGGMILRGPGAEAREGYYPAADVATYKAIGEDGEKMLPFYKLMVIWSDLYPVNGGFVNWTGETLGIISFTNELWNSSQYFSSGPRAGYEFDDDVGNTERRLLFDDLLMLGETHVDWHEVEHPDYGTIEVGGFRKMTGRTPPAFMIEEMTHRNAAFCMFHAYQMPKLSVVEVDVAEGAGDSRIVTVEFRNERWIPTRTAVAAERGIDRPDLVTISGDDLVVVAGGPGADRFDLTDFAAVEHEPERLQLERGVPGHGTVRLRWIVRGSGDFTVTLDAQKGGVVTATGTL
jgi:hypothetical protein